MSSPSHQVIAHQANGAMKVFPEVWKLLSKKDAQRLGSRIMGTQLSEEVGSLIVKTEIVEVVQTANMLS